MDLAIEAFLAHRNLLFTVTYEMAGCPPTVSAASGHGMILTERRVDDRGRDISCRLGGPGP
jgi:hypothetical protein